jgi:hypothetical protein
MYTTTRPVIIINETLDTLVTSDSKINLKIHDPTRLFGNNDLGKIEFNLKSIIDDYYIKQQNTNNDDISPSLSCSMTLSKFHNIIKFISIK